MKVSQIQKKALVGLLRGPRSAYDLRVSTATMFALNRRSLVVSLGHPGGIFFPQNERWRLSAAGEDLAKELNHG